MNEPAANRNFVNESNESRAATGLARAGPFCYRVYWEDTDAGGIVYHANYLRFAERARSDWMRSFFTGQKELRDRLGLAFVVRHMTIEFFAAAHLDDEVQVMIDVRSMSGSKLVMGQTVRRGEERVVDLQVVLVCINHAGRPTRLPSQLISWANRVNEQEQVAQEKE